MGGISVTKVKGCEYVNFYAQDMIVNHTRIEIFTRMNLECNMKGELEAV